MRPVCCTGWDFGGTHNADCKVTILAERDEARANRDRLAAEVERLRTEVSRALTFAGLEGQDADHYEARMEQAQIERDAAIAARDAAVAERDEARARTEQVRASWADDERRGIERETLLTKQCDSAVNDTAERIAAWLDDRDHGSLGDLWAAAIDIRAGAWRKNGGG